MSNGLGRGLGSLIPQKKDEAQEKPDLNSISKDDKDRVLQIAPAKIKTNPWQPRQEFDNSKLEELVKSIQEHGIIQPLVVSRDGEEYELIAGERRLRAAKEAGLKTVPAILREADNKKKLELALIENIQRQDLNPVETAHAYQQLMTEFGLKQDDLAAILGKSRSAVTNTLRYLKLPLEIREALATDRITESHAKYLVGVEPENKQLSVFKKIVNNNLSVRDTNKVIKHMGGTKEAQVKVNYSDKNKEIALREVLSTKVEIRRGRNGGQIVIDFYSDEELNDIVNKIQ